MCYAYISKAHTQLSRVISRRCIECGGVDNAMRIEAAPTVQWQLARLTQRNAANNHFASPFYRSAENGAFHCSLANATHRPLRFGYVKNRAVQF
ncbi:jg19538 [Pararge aegeria aegeria]|uniref:Jg19538 protein n=1 Tax=Pararge aegeria aegeria TaxID=348720 RepID=A0A8S4R5U9_9NEOP|nr:jg19538 [Pararge aegeria aegeria]